LPKQERPAASYFLDYGVYIIKGKDINEYEQENHREDEICGDRLIFMLKNSGDWCIFLKIFCGDWNKMGNMLPVTFTGM